MNTLLMIVLVVGTLSVIFQKQIVDFLFEHCGFDKMIDLDNYFLSATEKRRKKEMRQLLDTPPGELQLPARKIVEKCGKKYDEPIQPSVALEIMAKLPADVQRFFAVYDYLLINNDKILDIKKMEEVIIDGRSYYIIGKAPQEQALYMVADQGRTPQDQMIYEQEYNVAPDLSRHIFFIEESNYKSFNNFICFAAAYFSEE